MNILCGVVQLLIKYSNQKQMINSFNILREITKILSGAQSKINLSKIKEKIKQNHQHCMQQISHLTENREEKKTKHISFFTL